MCCVCRLDTPNLIDLRYKDEAMNILNKLKEFIDLNVSKMHAFFYHEECVEKSLTRVFHEFCCEIVMNNLHLTIPAKIFLN